jgi:hypothetical protein
MNGVVHMVVGPLDEKGLLLVLPLQTGDDFIGQRVRREVTVFQRELAAVSALEVTVRMPTEIGVTLGESLLERAVGGRPAEVAFVMQVEMPFAKKRSVLTRLRQHLGEGRFSQRQIRRIRRWLQALTEVLGARFLFGHKLKVQSSWRFAS